MLTAGVTIHAGYLNKNIDNTPQITPQVNSLLATFKGALSLEATKQEIMGSLGLKDRKNFRKLYLLPALGQGLIEMTIPDKPSSRNQKYRLINL